MSRSLNKVILIGNLGSAPEARTTSSGTNVAKVSLATNRTFQDRSGQEREATEWHRLTFFGRLAEVVKEHLGKGDRIYVEGRLHYSTVDGDDGLTRHFTEVVVGELIMLGSPGPGEQREPDRTPSSTSNEPEPPISEPDDGLPF